MDTITIQPAEVLVVKVTPVVSGGTVDGGGGASDIGDLTSVTITDPQSGDVLVYNGNVWVNSSITDAIESAGLATTAYVDAADDTLQANIDAETALRSSGDTTLASTINTEINDRQTADTTLQANIDAEEAARIAADNTLQANIDAEEATRIAAVNTLQANIDAEEARALGVEAALAVSISTEATTRTAADNTLQANIDAEATARVAADNTLQANIDTEEAARASADTDLQNQIDAISSGGGTSINSLTGTVTISSSDSSVTVNTNNQTDTIDLSVSSSTYGDSDVTSLLSSGDIDTINFTDGSATLTWNTEDATLNVAYNNGVSLQLGQEQYVYGKASEAISNGDLVMFAGVQGNHVLLAKADQSTTGFIPEWVIGVATQDFALNDYGYVTTFGKVNGLDTSLLSPGALLYMHPSTPGALTISEPTPAQGHSILVAAVLDSNPSVGTILVRPSHKPDTDETPEGTSNLYFTNARADARIAAASLEDISDVTITSATNGQALVWNGGAWVNGDVASAGGLTAVSDDTSPSLGGDLTSGYHIIMNDLKVIRFGGSATTYPYIGYYSAGSPGLNIATASHDFTMTGGSNTTLEINYPTVDINGTTVNVASDFVVTGDTALSDTSILGDVSVIGGNITFSGDGGLVDGRDVSADGTKLDTLVFGADVNATVPTGGNEGNYAIAWDSTSGKWVSKIPLLPNLNYIETVNTGTTNAGAILTYNGNTSKWEASTNTGGVVINDISDALTALNNIEGILKVSEGTKLYNTENDTTKGYINLGETDSFFGVNNTHLKIQKNSPGSITLSVDSGPSAPETKFDAVVISGTTTTDTATTTISEGNTLTFDIGSNSATLTPSVLTSDVDISLPASSGTLLVDSEVGGSNDLVFDSDYGIETGSASFKFITSDSALEILSGNITGNTSTKFHSGLGGSTSFNVGGYAHLTATYGQVTINQNVDFVLLDSNFKATISPPTLSSNVTYTLPSSTGTLALLSDITGGGASEVVNETGTTRTLISSDANKYIVCTSPSAITVNVNTGVFSVGDEILIEQGGAGQVTIAGTATVNTSSANTKKTAEQYAVVGLKCVATNTFTLTGERELA